MARRGGSGFFSGFEIGSEAGGDLVRNYLYSKNMKQSGEMDKAKLEQAKIEAENLDKYRNSSLQLQGGQLDQDIRNRAFSQSAATAQLFPEQMRPQVFDQLMSQGLSPQPSMNMGGMGTLGNAQTPPQSLQNAPGMAAPQNPGGAQAQAHAAMQNTKIKMTSDSDGNKMTVDTNGQDAMALMQNPQTSQFIRNVLPQNLVQQGQDIYKQQAAMAMQKMQAEEQFKQAQIANMQAEQRSKALDFGMKATEGVPSARNSFLQSQGIQIPRDSLLESNDWEVDPAVANKEGVPVATSNPFKGMSSEDRKDYIKEERGNASTRLKDAREKKSSVDQMLEDLDRAKGYIEEGSNEGAFGRARASFDTFRTSGENKLNEITQRIVNESKKPGSGQVTNADASRFEAMAPSPLKGAEENKIGLEAVKAKITYDKDYNAFLESYAKTHRGTLIGADEAWKSYYDQNPIYVEKRKSDGTIETVPNKRQDFREFFRKQNKGEEMTPIPDVDQRLSGVANQLAQSKGNSFSFENQEQVKKANLPSGSPVRVNGKTYMVK